MFKASSNFAYEYVAPYKERVWTFPLRHSPDSSVLASRSQNHDFGDVVLFEPILAKTLSSCQSSR